MIEFHVRVTSPNPVPHQQGASDIHCPVMSQSLWWVFRPLPEWAAHLSGDDKISHEISQGIHSSKCFHYKQIVARSEIGEEKLEKVGDNYLDKLLIQFKRSVSEIKPMEVLRFYVTDFTLSVYF